MAHVRERETEVSKSLFSGALGLVRNSTCWIILGWRFHVHIQLDQDDFHRDPQYVYIGKRCI